MRVSVIPCVALGALAFGACVLDFDRFEGAADDGGSGGTGNVGLMGGTGGFPESCTNDALDGDESDVDCGGSCPLCDNGLMCNGGTDCRSGFCSGGVCAPCSTDPDCADQANHWCDASVEGGSCVPQKDDGLPCMDVSECISGACVDDVCCDSICNSLCQGCASSLTIGADGVCTSLLGTTDPDDECAGTDVCNGSGTCAPFCGLEPTPPGGTCPAECTGGCAGGVCTISCDTGNACNGDAIACPSGWACQVSCGGNSGCTNATVTCPPGYACDLSCDANNACQGLTLNCDATGTCGMTCSNDNQVCRSSVVNCGTNACTVTCASTQFPPTVNTGSSCMPMVSGC